MTDNDDDDDDDDDDGDDDGDGDGDDDDDDDDGDGDDDDDDDDDDAVDGGLTDNASLEHSGIMVSLKIKKHSRSESVDFFCQTVI